MYIIRPKAIFICFMRFASLLIIINRQRKAKERGERGAGGSYYSFSLPVLLLYACSKVRVGGAVGGWAAPQGAYKVQLTCEASDFVLIFSERVF